MLRLQISRREKVLLKPESKLITPIYSDLLPYPILAMRLEEVVAEKVRAIMTRDEPRDVYDLYLLVKKGTIIHDYLVRRKLEGYAEFSLEKFEEQINKKEGAWNKELEDLLFKASAEHIVDFHTAKRTILESLNKNASATIEFRKDDEGTIEFRKDDEGMEERWKGINAHNITYLSLGNLANINGVSIHTNKKIKLDLFFFEPEVVDSAYISVYENENPRRDIPPLPPVYPEKLSKWMNGYIIVGKGTNLRFKLFIEKGKAGKLPDILHMALLLSEA